MRCHFMCATSYTQFDLYTVRCEFLSIILSASTYSYIYSYHTTYTIHAIITHNINNVFNKMCIIRRYLVVRMEVVRRRRFRQKISNIQWVKSTYVRHMQSKIEARKKTEKRSSDKARSRQHVYGVYFIFFVLMLTLDSCHNVQTAEHVSIRSSIP